MNDVSCEVCGEPWNLYGVDHGDMYRWEAVLFKRGLGCPCCGPSRGDDEPELDEWIKPEPLPIEGCECHSCGVKVGLDPEDNETIGRLKGEPMRVWIGGEETHYEHGMGRSYGGHHGHEDAYDHGEPENWLTIEGEKHCPGCARICGECETVIGDGPNNGHDTHDAGSPFPDPRDPYHGSPVCLDCMEKLESEMFDDHVEET